MSAVPSKAAEFIADHLRRDIATGRLRDGDALPPEGDLLGHFRVSRPTLRSAFRILEAESLLVISRGRTGGPRVRHPGTEVLARNLGLLLQVRGARLGDLDQIRMTLEPAAASLLATERPAAALERLEALLDQEAAALEAGRWEEFAERAVDFYRSVATLGGNEILALFGTVVHVLMPKPMEYLFRAEVGEDPGRIEAIARECVAGHRHLLLLISSGRDQESREFWRCHLDWLASTSDGLDPTHGQLPFTAFE